MTSPQKGCNPQAANHCSRRFLLPALPSLAPASSSPAWLGTDRGLPKLHLRREEATAFDHGTMLPSFWLQIAPLASVEEGTPPHTVLQGPTEHRPLPRCRIQTGNTRWALAVTSGRTGLPQGLSLEDLLQEAPCLSGTRKSRAPWLGQD